MTDTPNDKPVRWYTTTVRFTLTVECEAEVEVPSPRPSWMTAEDIATEAWERDRYREVARSGPNEATTHTPRKQDAPYAIRFIV